MRRFLAVLALCAPLPAWCASSFTPDVSDLWWNPAESGWGLNLIEQSNVLFGTFFVYASDGHARWYVASNLTSSGASGDRSQVFRGDLYESTGPVVLSMPFDPASVVRRRVGDATLQYTAPNTISLAYTVDGLATTKTLQRQTWAANDITGRFGNVVRALRGVSSGGICVPGPMYDYLGTMVVTASGSRVTVKLGTTSGCDYIGEYSQAGRMSTLSGTFACTSGGTAGTGTFTLSEIEVGAHGFMARLEQNTPGCQLTGHLGAARTTLP
jgi:hypothetical protein